MISFQVSLGKGRCSTWVYTHSHLKQHESTLSVSVCAVHVHLRVRNACGAMLLEFKTCHIWLMFHGILHLKLKKESGVHVLSLYVVLNCLMHVRAIVIKSLRYVCVQVADIVPHVFDGFGYPFEPRPSHSPVWGFPGHQSLF